ncbi:MAG: MarR family winged helix-turn-helix transcriptional regulator [Janthinobacterium lividum]
MLISCDMTPLRNSRQTEARRCTETIRDLLLGYKARMEEELRKSGVTLPQIRMLKAVAQQNEASAASIARLCHITPQTLQSILTRATREGWIVRGSSPSNGRIVTASLTPRGEAILQQGLEAAGRIEAQIWSGIPLASMQAMRATLESGLVNLNRD